MKLPVPCAATNQHDRDQESITEGWLLAPESLPAITEVIGKRAADRRAEKIAQRLRSRARLRPEQRAQVAAVARQCGPGLPG